MITLVRVEFLFFVPKGRVSGGDEDDKVFFPCSLSLIFSLSRTWLDNQSGNAIKAQERAEIRKVETKRKKEAEEMEHKGREIVQGGRRLLLTLER